MPEIVVSTSLFGTINNPMGVYPNDVVRLDLRNINNQYLETNYRVLTYSQRDNLVTLDPEKDLSDLGYIAGRYNVTYKFHRNLLGCGDADGHRVVIQEISADGLEIRVTAVASAVHNNSNFFAFFKDGFFSVPKAQSLVNLYLHKDSNTSLKIFDFVQDKLTIRQSPYSIIFKLTQPAPSGVVIGDLMWLSQQVSEDVADSITIVPPKYVPKGINIAGPNWDVVSKNKASTTTQYKDWEDLISTDAQLGRDLINSLMSGSLVEGIPLNIDYRNFKNYIFFGSATERLYNFRHKMLQLESYDNRIKALTTDLNGLSDSWSTGSVYFLKNTLEVRTQKAALIGAMDKYEKYLLNESSSYVTNSFGEFYPTTWPKKNSAPHYLRYSVTSSQAENWFNGIISSASIYDQNNNNALYKLIPAHILEDPNNEQYVLFTNMIGHYYDIVYAYIKQMSLNSDRNESLTDGFSKELVYHISKNLGLDFDSGNNLEDLWNYALGTDATGSLVSTYALSTEDRVKEVWKRIINNLPYLLKTKGTERSVRALINCFGIPSTVLRIREYGGAEPDFNTKTDYVYDRFNYSLVVGYNSSSDATNSRFQYITVPWTAADGTGTRGWLDYPNTATNRTLELQVRMAPNQTKRQSIFEVDASGGIKGWSVQAFQENSVGYVGLYDLANPTTVIASVSCSIYDSTWHHIAVRLNSTTSDISIRKVAYNKVVETARFDIPDDSASLVWSYGSGSDGTYDAKLYIPGYSASLSHLAAVSHSIKLFTGSIQEVRYWNGSTTSTTQTQPTLINSILNNHALAPSSYQGNPNDTNTGSTSSFSDLVFRLCLGADNKRINYAATKSLYSQHPNQTLHQYGGVKGLSVPAQGGFPAIFITASFFNFSGFGSGSTPLASASIGTMYLPEVGVQSLEWPDLGGNRSVSNKIRITSGVSIADNMLYSNNRAEHSTSDNNPPDSSRLGIYFSPTNETNQDIAEQFGGLSIDEYIGNPADLSLDHYPALEDLNYAYFKKYKFDWVASGSTTWTQPRTNPQKYIKLLRYYDASMFQLIKKFVPYRANTQVGLVIEPHLLSRSKFQIIPPKVTELQYYSVIDAASAYVVGGWVADGDGEPFRDGSNYVQAGTINSNESTYVVPRGEYLPYYLYLEDYIEAGTIGGSEYKFIEISGESAQVREVLDVSSANTSVIRICDVGMFDGDANVYEVLLDDVWVSGSRVSRYRSEIPTGTTNLRESSTGRDTGVLGSQYQYNLTYMTSGSGSTRSEPYLITASRYDCFQPLQPTIQSSRRSEFADVAMRGSAYDIFGNKAFVGTFNGQFITTTGYADTTQYSASSAEFQNLWTSRFGLKFQDTYTGSVLWPSVYSSSADYGYWHLNQTTGLSFTASSATPYYTSSFTIPAFYYNANDTSTQDYLYAVELEHIRTGTEVIDADDTLYFGSLGGSLSASVTPSTINLLRRYTNSSTKATGPLIAFTFRNGAANKAVVPTISKLRVRCLNYRAEVQDFHLRDSYGMRMARYDGCKLTSADWNVDSLDTVDKGPVVTVTVGGGVQLISTLPGARGSLKVSPLPQARN